MAGSGTLNQERFLGVGWRRPSRQLVERRRRRNAEVHPLRPANREPAQIVPDVDRTDRRRDVGIAVALNGMAIGEVVIVMRVPPRRWADDGVTVTPSEDC